MQRPVNLQGQADVVRQMACSSVKRFLAAALATGLLALVAPAGALAFGPLSSFGSSGTGAGQLSGPGNLDIGPDGSLYVPDFFNNRVDVFSPEGAFLFAFGKEVGVNGTVRVDTCTTTTRCIPGLGSAAAGAIEHPRHLAVAPGGDVYVSNFNHNRVDVFSPRGEFRFAFGKGVNPGGGNICTVASGCRMGIADSTAGSSKPVGLAIDAAGAVYVAEGTRVSVFSPQGEFRFAFGKNVRVGAGPPDVCDAQSGCKAAFLRETAGGFLGADLDFTPAGNLAILDGFFHRVSVFSPQGEFRFSFGKEVNAGAGGGDTCTAASGCKEGVDGTGAGEISASVNAIAIDPAGAVFISNSQVVERVDQFTATGAFVRAFGAGVTDGKDEFQICTAATGCRSGVRSEIPGGLNVPEGIAVDGRGSVYVAESNTADHIQRFGEPDSGQPPPPVVPPAGPILASDGFELGKLRLNLKRGVAKLAATVSGPGVVVLKGKGLRRFGVTARKAGKVELTVRLVGEAARKLARTGRARVRARVTFTPDGRVALTKTKALVLRKKLAR